MDMGSLLGTILGAILNYKSVPMSTLDGPLVKQILTIAHVSSGGGCGTGGLAFQALRMQSLFKGSEGMGL